MNNYIKLIVKFMKNQRNETLGKRFKNIAKLVVEKMASNILKNNLKRIFKKKTIYYILAKKI